MAISDWMPTLVTKLGQVTGLAANGSQPHRVRGYDDLPGSLAEGLTGIVLPLRAAHTYSAGGPGVWVHELQFTVYTPGLVLPEAYAVLVPLIKLVRDKMAANVMLGGLSWSGGKISHWLPLTDAPFYEGPGAVGYGGQEYQGIIFRMEVKEVETAVTVTA